jgi:hypothetical protein
MDHGSASFCYTWEIQLRFPLTIAKAFAYRFDQESLPNICLNQGSPPVLILWFFERLWRIRILLLPILGQEHNGPVRIRPGWRPNY